MTETTSRSELPRHLERVDWVPRGAVDLDRWPFAIPAVAQLIEQGGLEVPPGVTILVGENGSGKSTIVEALAEVYPRAGAKTPFAHALGPRGSAEDSPLPRHLRARAHPLASPHGFFLRAEAMHGFLAAVDADPTQTRAWSGERLQDRSHGESFLTVLRHRFDQIGVYFLDEPEAALSFRSCLGLVALLDVLRAEGSQVVVATHSPVISQPPRRVPAGARRLGHARGGLRRAGAGARLSGIPGGAGTLAPAPGRGRRDRPGGVVPGAAR